MADRNGIAVVGDIILERRPNPATVEAVGKLLNRGDLVVCSFEGVLSERGAPLPKEIPIRTPIPVASDLRATGVDVAALANNHTTDYGVEALTDTIETLTGVGIATPGAGRNRSSAFTPATLAVGNARIAVLSVTCAFPVDASAAADRPGLATLRIHSSVEWHEPDYAEQPGMAPRIRTWPDESDLHRLLAEVATARRQADRVIVVMHWGIHPPWRPAAYGPLAEYQQPLGRALIDAGTDAVLGNHAVELQGIELYNGGIIAYCLGVFWYDGLAGYPWVGREAVILRLRAPSPSMPFEAELVPVLMDDSGVPDRDHTGRVINLLRKASAPFGTEIVALDGRWTVRLASPQRR